MDLAHVWQQLCRAYVNKKLHFIPSHIFAALHLFHYDSLDKDPRDAHERLLHRILSGEKGLKKEFIRVIHEKPHAPIEALCMLHKKAPVLATLLGLSMPELKRRVHNIDIDWINGEMLIALIKSIEIWLKAFLILK